MGIILPISLAKRKRKLNSSFLWFFFLSTHALDIFKEGFVTSEEKKP